MTHTSTSAKIVPVILCGGSGTRLWPLSRASYPKQFAQLVGERSLFQQAAARLSGPDFAAPIVVTTDAFRFIVTEQLAAMEIDPGAILIEPEGRDTAAAVLAATLHATETAPDALVLVAPSDHLIPEAEAFAGTLRAAAPAAREGRVVTFGITPDRPETGYGYLRLREGADMQANVPQPLERFVEKPDADRARDMLQDGRHLWNAGIFLFRADTMREAFAAHAPDLLEGVGTALGEARRDLGFIRLEPVSWGGLAKISLDYAVMEKLSALSVMPFSGTWSDLGDWTALWRQTEEGGMAVSGPVTAMDCEGSLLRSENPEQALVGIGLKDIVAVAMPDAVLVAHKDRAQEVKQAVAALHEAGHKQAHTLPIDYRPWGWFESLIQGTRFQVKQILVHPGAALSLQSHHHRSEHWIVVQGTAKVTIDDEVKLVSENQSVYLPLGCVHRMENPGKVPMLLIEVQTGSYLGEDDIIRYEDVYARD